MSDDSASSPERVVGRLRALVERLRAGEAETEVALVAALTALRELQAETAGWEPELVAAARSAGVSWLRLAPALGVTSRQAAERRYLRMRTTEGAGATKEARVQATRDRRAGERAVTAWARQNSAELRQLAGQVSGLADLTGDSRREADRVHVELGGDDSATLLEPLSAMRSHLREDHPELAARIGEMSADADQRRRDAVSSRQTQNPADPDTPGRDRK